MPVPITHPSRGCTPAPGPTDVPQRWQPRPARRPYRLLVMLGLLGHLLAGCAVSTPFPRIPAAPQGADDTVVLVISRVVVETGNRREFDRQTRHVIDAMPAQPGLLGYSARRQLFGDTAWTLSVWTSEAAMARFVDSAVHRTAIARSRPALITVELKRLQVPRRSLPTDWLGALELLNDPAGIRYDWE